MNDDHVDGGLVLMTGVIVVSSIMASAAIALIASGGNVNGAAAAAECRNAAAAYLKSAGSEAGTQNRRRTLSRACGGPHALLIREIMNPLTGEWTCESAVAEHLRATGEPVQARAPERSGGEMARTCDVNQGP